MILSNAPISEATHTICDWFELAVLSSEYGVYAFESLARFWDTLRNSEGKDPEGADDTEEAFITTVRSEIEARADLLGDCYPFQFSSSGESLEFVEANVTQGGWIYIFCLLISHPSQGAIFDGKYQPPITNEIRNYFQACATYAAAGELEGHSYAFGFPRPDKSGFLEKLTAIYVNFGEGTQVVNEVPKGAPDRQKDAQIDVIAWRPSADAAAGKPYLLGQVASGANWQAKTIKGGPIDSFHNVWFARSPASIPTASMFVPICYGSIWDDTMRDAVNHHSYEFGHIFYRFRIPPLAQKGIKLAAANANITIERLADLGALITWLQVQIEEMRRISREAA
ncbi:MAG: hypothetical protein ACOZE7_01735 [Pseudomonadota bacterium]